MGEEQGWVGPLSTPHPLEQPWCYMCFGPLQLEALPEGSSFLPHITCQQLPFTPALLHHKPGGVGDHLNASRST